MPSFDETPRFNLKAVVQETGVQAETLRAWERRYGLPQPGRTSGGHRLYSERDIETIKWLSARKDEGMRIGQAVDLWNSLQDEGLSPLTHPDYAVPVEPATARLDPEGVAVEGLRQGWISACLTFDERRADSILRQALALYPAESVCLDLIVQAMNEIGQAWYSGRASVQQEHFASELAARHLESLIAASPIPTRPLRLLVVSPPEEEHTLPALILTFIMRRRGWDALFLGANVPADKLDATLSSTRPNLVILPAQTLHTAATSLDFVPILHEQRTPLAFGGLIFERVPELANVLPGRYLGDSLKGAASAVEDVLGRPANIPDPDQIPNQLQPTLTAFREHRARIEMLVRQASDQMDILKPHRDEAVFNLSQGLEDALRLGNPDYLTADLDWISGHMSNLELPDDLMAQFIGGYLRAAKQALPQGAQPVVDWLENFHGRVTEGQGGNEG